MVSTSPYFRSTGAGTRSRSSFQLPSKKAAPPKQNTSILNFFKKADGPPKSTQKRITQYVTKQDKSALEGTGNTAGNNDSQPDSLFFEEDIPHLPDSTSRPSQEADDDKEEDIEREFFPRSFEEERYNEYVGALKRRKLEPHWESQRGVPEMVTAEREDTRQHSEIEDSPSGTGHTSRNGPFIDESDSDEDDVGIFRGKSGDGSSLADNKEISIATATTKGGEVPQFNGSPVAENEVEFLEPGGVVPDVENDELWDGENIHYAACENDDLGTSAPFPEEEPAVCPICWAGLGGMTDVDASLHVNTCLDGNSTPPPNARTGTALTRSESFTTTLTRAERKLLARPGQKNPFVLESKTTTTSAFSKLMSANAEDSAWAAAAANEVASRGKQSYERTCPFYKILPGFSICVDAFRYGAVEGCSAYFLSHFHSDHYMGLNASWCHGPIYCSRVTANLVKQQLKVNPKWVVCLEWETKVEVPGTDGVQVTMIEANHCPGSSLFLFEKAVGNGKFHRILHCGDFRASPQHVQHPLLRPTTVDPKTGKPKEQTIDVCYLDTTYLNPKYGLPCQEDVVAACAEKCVILDGGRPLQRPESRGTGQNIIKYLTETANNNDREATAKGGRLLIVIGTYSIGKERICLGIAKALKSKIYAPPAKQRLCACLEDEELSSLLTTDPLEAQVHMQSLMEIRADTLSDYLNSLKPHFSRVVGFRPTGWNYRPPAGRMTDNPPVNAVLYSDSWKSRFSADDLVPQRGSNNESICYAVPYSEHSSFRDLTMFCCALRIGRIIPTVNVGSRKSREKMKAWLEKWEAEKRKSGLFKVEEGATRW
ncbi:hypothetical protein VTO42DRAFT_4708 [Malbranchea cinnamomea]